MPSSQYGHTAQGINLTNYRLLTQSNERKVLGYRSPADWVQETKEHCVQTLTEQKCSTTLRHASSALQASAADMVVADLATVEVALRSKIAQTEYLKSALDKMITDVDSELAACSAVRAQLQDRAARVETKASLNAGRLQVREGRPTRERTMDEVERHLLLQQNLISSYAEKVRRAISHVDREVEQLESIKARLLCDLRDKADAIHVDTAVLGVGPNGEVPASPGGRRADHPVRTPATWVRSTEENLANARHWLADSARLRKAIKHAMSTARQAEHDLARSLNAAMQNKLAGTNSLKQDVHRQLDKVGEEMTKLASQRASLASALDAKRGPLAQAKERWALRKARPARETVKDDVEAALVREIAHLNAVTGQLSDKVRAVDKELDALALASTMLEDNLRDKDAAIAHDERCVLLDGRINMTTPPPSTVASMSASSTSSARAATMRRIADLEAELTSARREREALESGVDHLRLSLGLHPGSSARRR